jgi:hypothetical protein
VLLRFFGPKQSDPDEKRRILVSGLVRAAVFSGFLMRSPQREARARTEQGKEDAAASRRTCVHAARYLLRIRMVPGKSGTVLMHAPVKPRRAARRQAGPPVSD